VRSASPESHGRLDFLTAVPEELAGRSSRPDAIEDGAAAQRHDGNGGGEGSEHGKSDEESHEFSALAREMDAGHFSAIPVRVRGLFLGRQDRPAGRWR